MEGLFFGFALLIIFGLIALCAAPVAVIVAGIVAWCENDIPPHERLHNPVTVGIGCFMLLMFAACAWLEYL